MLQIKADYALIWQGTIAQARACYFDVVNKWGAFGSVPLTAGHSMSPVFGLRYSTPLVTAGGMLSPTEGKLHSLWLVSLSFPTRQDLLQQAHESAASQIS